ncbi:MULTISPECIES: cell division protein FtsZ [unclassified Spiroplasma]|uniref:cell division protein FtsZ n=1 Tax=unclassified Spiroplasma TaxID=2637901 RepID=UPI0020795963|nr:cell division protein FtsZ [Spiroplasma endosymbiont of Lariophagus distinguendus]MBP1525687.1 cell division protein FtsZ [Spiroplasma ixodetis]MBP1528339.1 cell division protein FtsZ [Spiroplasma ixodetis]
MEHNNSQFKPIASIRVIGIGGAGNNAVNRMIEAEVQGVDFYVANTDAQVVNASPAENKIILGKELSKGLGAGANPEIGKQAAIESEAEIKRALDGADMVFIAAGMGGGTGTGAASIVARIAKECGALTIAIVTKPFKFEGRNRNAHAIVGIENLKKQVDAIIIISNDKLLQVIGNIPLKDSFKEADNILRQGVQTITDLIAVPALINLDFADVRTIIENKGNALFGIGMSKGEHKAKQAATKAISSPLLDDVTIKGAKNAIVNVTGGTTMTLTDANIAVDLVRDAAGNDVNIIFGVAVNENLNDEMIVTVIATGFDEEGANANNFVYSSKVDNHEFITNKTQYLSEEIKEQTKKKEEEQQNLVQEAAMEADDDLPSFLRRRKGV